MKIKSFFTEQFAGISLDKPIIFSDGMNVVLGDNETGKSTMISAMYYALNKSRKVDRVKDKDFIATFFPSGGGNTTEATVCIQEGEKKYEIEKVWDRENKDSVAKFRPENEERLRGPKAEEELEKVLKYGSAVYGNLIFGRQNNEDEVLKWCYQFFSAKTGEGMDETRRKITEAFSAAGGISSDKLVELINNCLDGDSAKKIKGLTGNWDFDRDLPKRRTPQQRAKSERWEKKNGSIIEAYYAYKDAETEYKNAADTEDEIVEKTRKIAERLEEKSEVEAERDELIKQHGAIADREKTKKLCGAAEREQKEIKTAISLWPLTEKRLDSLNDLKREKEEKEKRELKESLSQLIRQVRELEKANEKISGELTEVEDYKDNEQEAEKLSDRIREIRGMLTAVRLRASVAMEQGYKAAIIFADGTEKEIDGTETIDTKGFVRLNIPGVASIQVSPQELDVEGLQREEKEKDEKLSGILRKYGVETVEKLRATVREIENKKTLIQGNKREIKIVLKGKSIEEYETEEKNLIVDESVSIRDSLEEEIRQMLEILESDSLEKAQGALETALEGYKEKYGTQNSLPKKLVVLADEVKAYEKELENYGNVPEISVEKYEEKIGEFKDRIEALDRTIGDLRTDIGILSVREVTDISGLKTKVEEEKQRWLHEKKQYELYIRIKEDFCRLRSKEGDHFEEFYDKFNEYLHMITNGRVSYNVTGDGLSLQSAAKQVSSKELLSRGTRKTVLLAFRLAVLDYFFPDGDGLVVLDDDLLDMDPDRREQAARLLKDFAKSNQVIFTTCDPSIADLLGGNLISMQR